MNLDEIENLSEENINELYDDIIEGNLAYTIFSVYCWEYGYYSYLTSPSYYREDTPVNYCTQQHCDVLADGYGTGCVSYAKCNPNGEGAGRVYNAYFCITGSINR